MRLRFAILSFAESVKHGIANAFTEFAEEYEEKPEKTLAGHVRCGKSVHVWFSQPEVFTSTTTSSVIVTGDAFVEVFNDKSCTQDMYVGVLNVELPTGNDHDRITRGPVFNVSVWLSDGVTELSRYELEGRPADVVLLR